MAKRRFSVRIKIVVPPGGLGQRRIQDIFLRRGTDGSQTRRWREGDSNLYGAFPVKWLFWFVAGFLFGAGKPFFVL